MAKIKSSWWRPQSLAELGRWSDDEIRRQERAYIVWLRRRYGCSEKDAQLLVQVQRDEMQGAPDATSSGSRIREEKWISERVCIRTVRTHHTKKHYGPALPVHWQWHRCPEAIRWWLSEPKWVRPRKPDAPTHYVVMQDGRRRDSFLSRSRAREYAERIARECSSAK